MNYCSKCGVVANDWTWTENSQEFGRRGMTGEIAEDIHGRHVATLYVPIHNQFGVEKNRVIAEQRTFVDLYTGMDWIEARVALYDVEQRLAEIDRCDEADERDAAKRTS